jgi:hypothetical protein
MREKKRPMRSREFVQFMAAVSAGGTYFGNTVLMMTRDGKRVTRNMVRQAERLTGIRFTPGQREMMVPALQNCVESIQAIRNLSIPAEMAPALYMLTDTSGIWSLAPKKIIEG